MRWSELAARPDLEAVARSMFYEHGLGLGFLATTRPDGGRRVHPICPLLAGNRYAFIVPGPKLTDLRRDARYAPHSETFAPPRHQDAAYLTGRVSELADPPLRGRLTAQILAERNLAEPWPGFESEPLVELHLDSILVTLTGPRRLPAGHTIWRPSPAGLSALLRASSVRRPRTALALGAVKVPVACTLSAAEGSDRIAGWRAALGATVTMVSRPAPARAELRLVGEPGDIAKLVDLARREKACCEFFGFTFEVSREAVTLVVTVPNDAVDVLDDFTALAAATTEPPSAEGISDGDTASTG